MINFAPLHGWLRHGIQRKQSFPGWSVFASPKTDKDVPVTIIQGHYTVVSESGHLLLKPVKGP